MIIQNANWATKLCKWLLEGENGLEGPLVIGLNGERHLLKVKQPAMFFLSKQTEKGYYPAKLEKGWR